MLSDHALIITTVDTRVAPPAPPVSHGHLDRSTFYLDIHAVSPRVRRRRWAAFSSSDFIAELSQSQLVLNPSDDV